MAETGPTYVQIILAVIASGIAVSLFTTFYNDFYRKPYIVTDIWKSPYTQHQEYIIRMVNKGIVPAENVTLTILSPSTIGSFSYFSTEEIDLMRNSEDPKDSLSGHLDRFSQGEGSLIRITTSLNETSNTTADFKAEDFVVYATYDEGTNISGGYSIFHEQLILIVAAEIVLLIAIIPLMYYFRRRKEKGFVFWTKNVLLSVYDKFDADPSYDKHLFGRSSPDFRFRLNRWELHRNMKIRSFSDIRDYQLINEFFKNIRIRENYLSEGKRDEAISQNEAIKKKSECALDDIEWSKF